MNVAVAPWSSSDLATVVDVKVAAVNVVIVLRSKLPVPISSVDDALVSYVKVPEKAFASSNVVTPFILIV